MLFFIIYKFSILLKSIFRLFQRSAVFCLTLSLKTNKLHSVRFSLLHRYLSRGIKVCKRLGLLLNLNTALFFKENVHVIKLEKTTALLHYLGIPNVVGTREAYRGGTQAFDDKPKHELYMATCFSRSSNKAK